MWDRTRSRYESGTGDSARRTAILEFIGLVSSLVESGAVDAIQQGLIVNQIAKLLNLPGEQVHRLYGQVNRGRSRSVAQSREGERQPSEADIGRSAEQAALTAILEVLLNESGYYESVAEVFNPQLFEDPVKRRIGCVVQELAGQVGEFRLVEVLDRLPDPADARVLTELEMRGRQRGNCEATLAGAVDRLRGRRAVKQKGLPASPDGDEDCCSQEDLVFARLRAVHQASRGFHDFAPRKKLDLGLEGKR